jgi:hypothetical protein
VLAVQCAEDKPEKAVNNNHNNNNLAASSKCAHTPGRVRAVLYDTVQVGRQSVDREAGQRAERPKGFLLALTTNARSDPVPPIACIVDDGWRKIWNER